MLKYLYLLHLLTVASSSYKILAVFPVQIKSHFKAFEPLLAELASRGHEITVITHFPKKFTNDEMNLHKNDIKVGNDKARNYDEFKNDKENNFGYQNSIAAKDKEKNNLNYQNSITTKDKEKNNFNYQNSITTKDEENSFSHQNSITTKDEEKNNLNYQKSITTKDKEKNNFNYQNSIPTKDDKKNISFRTNSKSKNYNEIILEGDILVDKISLDLMSNNRIQKYLTAKMITSFSQESCKKSLSSLNIQKLISSQIKFDLIITEFFANNCFLSLLKFFPAPLIATSSCFLLPWTNKYFSNPDNPSYIPIVFMDYPPKMNFLQRAENTVLTLLNYFFYEIWSVRPATEIVEEVLGVDVDLEMLAYNASLLLLNTHFSVSQSRPFVPGIVEVGGIHIGSVKKLPQNLEKWINESSDGVIYFSMGSMIKGHTFPEDKRRAFQRAFERLGQRVLWKWENDTMPGKPDNVMIQKWMPQFDILCHPNVRVFISHGGLLGTTEAVHCGVPVVVMPQFGDQHTNARALEASGGGVVLNFKDVNEDTVYSALKTVLDPKFNKQAKVLSERFRDRPMPPMETAIYWIEYVARHKGAHHMRTAAVGMPFYQYHLLDVIAFLSAIILCALYLIYKSVKFVLSKVCGGEKKKVKSN